MPSIWSQISKKMSMKIPCNFQVRTAGSYATVQTDLWRWPKAPQCLEASALKTSGRQSNTVRTLRQASPICTQSWISIVDTVWEVSARRPDDVATRPDDVQHSRIFQVSFTTAERRYSQDCLDTQLSHPDVDLIRIELCYFRKAVAVNRPNGRATSSGRISGFLEDFCACLSVFIINLFSSIGLRQNWCRWKAKKKSYNLKI
jgi:hypothetical protein